ncbi:DHH family phosphoesterase [Chryseobacterium daecheongense]|nr:DHH family phosphoesterase [Chryseobacterium daecheongense]
MMFTPAELLEINTLFSPESKIVILTHYNPDGDAIGSSFGLKHYLKAKGIHAEVIVPNDFPKFLKWMPESKKAIIAEYKRKVAYDLISEADVIFCLDFNAPSRIGIVGDWLIKATGKKFLLTIISNRNRSIMCIRIPLFQLLHK